MSCKRSIEYLNSKLIRPKTNRPMVISNCPICGRNKYKWLNLVKICDKKFFHCTIWDKKNVSFRKIPYGKLFTFNNEGSSKQVPVSRR